jgi:DNA polymerase-1
VLQALDESDLVGLDLETTGLNPRTDRVRLLSLATARGLFVLDCFAVDPRPLFDALGEKTIIGQHLLFDLSFLSALGFTTGSVFDTMLMSQLLTAGTRDANSLAAIVQRELGQTLPKELQQADWSGDLSGAQLRYAATDVKFLHDLHHTLTAKLKAAGLELVAEIENRCLPAMVWLARSGVLFDRASWAGLAGTAVTAAENLSRQLDAMAPAKDGELYGAGWNWDSPAQILDVFKVLGIKATGTADGELAKIDHPLAALLRKYREARKRCSTYGKDWLKHVATDSRIYAAWHQMGAAASGRMSCSGPNLQNLPRDPAYRRCFCAPEGRMLVKADYSQIELRIAAKVAGDTAMMEVYRRRQDLHALTAQRLLGKSDVSKQDRQLAKAANFGLLYGMGARGYRAYARNNYGVEMTERQAQGYREAFFAAYPGLRRWHRSMKDGAVATRTLTGRRRLGVDRFSEKLNTPVQGTGADGLKLAMALLWEQRDQCPGAFPVLAVHDEIVVECNTDQAEAVADWVKSAMVEAMAPLIDPVPVEVEVETSPTWGG